MTDDQFISCIERDFPHVALRVTYFWDTGEFFAFINGLLTTTNPNKKGFPDDAISELFFLETLHEELHPQGPPPWSFV